MRFAPDWRVASLCDGGGRPAARWPSSIRSRSPSRDSAAARSTVAASAFFPVAVRGAFAFFTAAERLAFADFAEFPCFRAGACELPPLRVGTSALPDDAGSGPRRVIDSVHGYPWRMKRTRAAMDGRAPLQSTRSAAQSPADE